MQQRAPQDKMQMQPPLSRYSLAFKVACFRAPYSRWPTGADARLCSNCHRHASSTDLVDVLDRAAHCALLCDGVHKLT